MSVAEGDGARRPEDVAVEVNDLYTDWLMRGTPIPPMEALIEIIRAYRDREVAEALAEQAVTLEQIRAGTLANIESADDWDGTPCEVCGQPCLYGSRHPDCYDKLKRAEAKLAEQAGEIERLTAALAHIAAEPPWMVIGGRGGTTPFGYILRLQRMAADALGAASGRKEAPGAG